MTTELQLELVTERPVPGVHAETPAGTITFGFSPDLNTAIGDALDAMLTWLQASYLASHGQPTLTVTVIQDAALHGYSIAYVIAVGIFTAGAALATILYRPGTPGNSPAAALAI